MAAMETQQQAISPWPPSAALRAEESAGALTGRLWAARPALPRRTHPPQRAQPAAEPRTYRSAPPGRPASSPTPPRRSAESSGGQHSRRSAGGSAQEGGEAAQEERQRAEEGGARGNTEEKGQRVE